MKISRGLLILAVIYAVVFGVTTLVNVAYAVTSSTLNVQAVVPNVAPDMTVLVKQLTTPGQDPFTGATVTSMTFGSLTHTLANNAEAGAWYSPNFFAAMIFANGFGKAYQITSTSLGLSGAGNSLPTGSFGIAPGYSATDEFSPGVSQGPQPLGSALGTAGSAIATNVLIYRSETAGSARIIRAFYSLPPVGAGGAAPFTGYQPIPLSQVQGTYTGTVTIAITQI